MCPPSARPSRRVACLHCGLRAGHSGRRNLCYPCWRHLPTRLNYPADPRGNRGRYPTAVLPEPKRSTSLRPGSLEKVDLIIWRLEHGLQLFHPLDDTAELPEEDQERARQLVGPRLTEIEEIERTERERQAEQSFLAFAARTNLTLEGACG